MTGKKRSKSASPLVTHQAKPYTGDLAKPARVCMLAHRLDPARPLPGFKGSREEWALHVAGLVEYQKAHLECLLCELAKHYGVPITALNGEADGWQRLVLALAMDHVPAFQVEQLRAGPTTRRGRPASIGWEDTTSMLLDAAALAQGEIDAGREEPGDAELGRQLAKREWAKRCKLTPGAIRKLLPQVRLAWAAVLDGHATGFQQQCVEKVLPFLHKVAR